MRRPKLNETDQIEPQLSPMTRSRRLGAEAAFRATVEQRLRNLEAQIEEVKTRLNGMLSFIAGTVLAQFVLRLLA